MNCQRWGGIYTSEQLYYYQLWEFFQSHFHSWLHIYFMDCMFIVYPICKINIYLTFQPFNIRIFLVIHIYLFLRIIYCQQLLSKTFRRNLLCGVWRSICFECFWKQAKVCLSVNGKSVSKISWDICWIYVAICFGVLTTGSVAFHALFYSNKKESYTTYPWNVRD